MNTKATIRMNVHQIEEKLNWPTEVIDALRVNKPTLLGGTLGVLTGRNIEIPPKQGM